jgi:hypothetical protein
MGWWTYEFCYKSHVRQFHMDMNSKKITEEHIIGYYNASTPFEACKPLRPHGSIVLDWQCLRSEEQW